MLGPADLQREAEATGFRSEALEKVLRLLELLEAFRSHPFLKSRLALEGGTALNLFVACGAAEGRAGDPGGMRAPGHPNQARSRRARGRVTEMPMLDVHELAAGKLAALFGRAAGRDLFDVRELLAATAFDPERLRLGFIVYGAINRRDWRTLSLDDVQADPREVDQQLVPLLRAGRAPAREDLAAWSGRLVAECGERLGVVLPYAPRRSSSSIT